MKRILIILSLLFSTIILFGQSQTLTSFVGTFSFSGFTAGGTSDVTGNLTAFNDQTNQYFATNIQVGDIIWDNLGNRWEVMVVNSSNLTQANVDLRDVNSAGGTPFGVGYVSRETTNVGLSLFPPDNNIGISQQLKSRVESHNMLLLDEYLGTLGAADTITVENGVTFAPQLEGVQNLTGEVILSDSSTNVIEVLTGLTPGTRNGLFADVDATEIFFTKTLFNITNLQNVTEILVDSMHVHKASSTVSVQQINGIEDATPDTIVHAVIISPDAGNTLTAKANGLYTSGGDGQGRDTVYDSGLGFWVYGTLGVTTSSNDQGNYTVSIPDLSRVLSIWVEFDDADDLTIGGEAVITVNHNTSAYHTSFANALDYVVSLKDSGGVQRNPGDVSITVNTSTPSAGSANTIIANLNGLGFPSRVKLTF